MLNENIQALRKSKGLSQEELALKLNVVRQTVSKWERGLSVPDAEMLVAIGEVLGTPVSTLLGETVPTSELEGLQALSEKTRSAERPVRTGTGIQATRAAHPLHRDRRRHDTRPYRTGVDRRLVSRMGFLQSGIRGGRNDAPRIRVGLRSNGTNHTDGIDRGRSCVPQIRPFIAFAIDLPWAPPRNGQHIEQ